MRGRPVGCAVALILLSACGAPRDEEEIPAAPAERLDRGGGVRERQLASEDARHDYFVELEAGYAFVAQVDQRGLDVVAELSGPGGENVFAFDSPSGQHGPETVCFLAETAGSFRLRVLADGPGTYVLRWQAVSGAGPSARSCWAAARASAEAEALRRAGEKPRELLSRYETVQALWREARQPFPEGMAWKRRGQLQAQLGDVRDEARGFEEALKLFREVGEPHQESRILSRLGHTYVLLDDVPKAREALDEALRIAREVEDPAAEATALNNLAVLEMSLGEAHRALARLERVLELWRSLGRRRNEGNALQNLGRVYSEELGRYADALDVLSKALEIRRETGQLHRQAETLLTVGWAKYRSGEIEEAIASYTEALGLSRRAERPAVEAAALDRLGTAYAAAGRHADALDAYRRSLALSEAAQNVAYLGPTRANLGWLLEETGRPEEALRELEEGRRLLAAAGDRDALAHVEVGLAKVQRRLGDLGAARRHLEDAMDLVESLRASARRQGARLAPDPLWQDYVELYFDVLMDLAGTDPQAARTALELGDLERSRNLYEILLEADVDLRGDADATLLQSERELLARLEALERRRLALLGQDALAQVERSQRALRLELLRTREEIRRSSPRFAEIWIPKPVRLDDVAGLLDPTTRLLSFHLGERRSFLFVVGPESLVSHVLPPREEIERRATAAYTGLANKSRRARKQRRWAVEALAELVLPPIGELSARRLVVVGEGALSYVPWAALPWPEPQSETLLVDGFEVVYLPAAATLPVLRRRASERKPASGRLAVVGDPAFSAAQGIPPLPHARREAETLLSLVAPDERLGALGLGARKDLVTGGALRNYRTLHFATHAVIEEERPGFSRILLSQVDASGRPVAGNLYLQEIYTLDLPADLVVLSACRTALGREVRGNGLVGLTRGFFYAGAARLVVSLWDVDDEATAELMIAFYRAHLARGLPAAAALREAQQELRRQEAWAHPYYWAGFVLQGDWE